jgi:hypothetical protein
MREDDATESVEVVHAAVFYLRLCLLWQMLEIDRSCNPYTRR